MEGNAIEPLSAVEARVLACLVEKEATTPEQYPLTENAVTVACNQKTSREPVMELSPGEVGHALRQLEQRRLVRSQHGSRAQRYEHRMAESYGLTRQQQAVLATLMLRGAQTAAEIHSRSERLAKLSGEELQHALDRLQQRQPPLLLRLPKAPGQREERYVHLLSGEVDVDALVARASSGDSTSSNRGELEARLAALEQRVEALERRWGDG